MEMRGLRRARVLATLLLTVAGGVSYGVPIDGSTGVVEITATRGKHIATYTGLVSPAALDAGLGWQPAGPLTLADDESALAVVQQLWVSTSPPHQVDLSFALTNSSLTEPTMFNIRTITIAFDAVPNAEAAAFAAVTLTDGAGSPAGAAMTGLLTDNRIYQARYSTDGVVNTSTVFASLAPSISFASGLSAQSAEALPTAGMLPLAGDCYMMESEFSFILSPGDQASGTSTFLVTPEPVTLVLLTLGMAGVLRRR